MLLSFRNQLHSIINTYDFFYPIFFWPLYFYYLHFIVFFLQWFQWNPFLKLIYLYFIFLFYLFFFPFLAFVSIWIILIKLRYHIDRWVTVRNYFPIRNIHTFYAWLKLCNWKLVVIFPFTFLMKTVKLQLNIWIELLSSQLKINFISVRNFVISHFVLGLYSWKLPINDADLIIVSQKQIKSFELFYGRFSHPFFWSDCNIFPLNDFLA